MPSSNNKRIAKNTVLLYIRMFLVMAVTLYTSRAVLDKLGITDYGIYNVVGGIVAMLGFLNGAMVYTVQRFLSFEMGRQNQEGVRRVFCVSLLVHATIALIFLLVMEIFGVWYLNNYLNIPPERLSAAFWVLQCSIVTAIFAILQVPYNAIIISKEKMGIYAYISVIEVLLKLGVVYLLTLTSFDRLKFYSVLVMTVSIGIMLIYLFWCVHKYQEAHFKLIKDWKLLKEMMSFAGWNLTSELAYSLTGPGVNVILNLFFGPLVNAAMGLANQVNGAVNKFIQNFQIAATPQITKQYAAGNLNEMEKLVIRSTKFSFFLALIPTLAIILQIDYILNIWLKKVPEGTGLFCQLILINLLISVNSSYLSRVAMACGRIKKFQIIVSTIIILNFPLSYIALFYGSPAYISLCIKIGLQIVFLFVALYIVCRLVKLSMKHYIQQVVLRDAIVACASLIIPILSIELFPTYNILRFIINSCVCIISTCIAIYLLGMDKNEKIAVRNGCTRFIKKLK